MDIFQGVLLHWSWVLFFTDTFSKGYHAKNTLGLILFLSVNIINLVTWSSDWQEIYARFSCPLSHPKGPSQLREKKSVAGNLLELLPPSGFRDKAILLYSIQNALTTNSSFLTFISRNISTSNGKVYPSITSHDIFLPHFYELKWNMITFILFYFTCFRVQYTLVLGK